MNCRARHRRLAAYRRLQLAAKTDADKAKYAAIPARELPHVDDEQMLLLGLTENLLRADRGAASFNPC